MLRFAARRLWPQSNRLSHHGADPCAKHRPAHGSEPPTRIWISFFLPAVGQVGGYSPTWLTTTWAWIVKTMMPRFCWIYFSMTINLHHKTSHCQKSNTKSTHELYFRAHRFLSTSACYNSNNHALLVLCEVEMSSMCIWGYTHFLRDSLSIHNTFILGWCP